MPTSRHQESTSRRCAACKHLRRRCTEDCPLSPYFPASSDPDSVEHKKFLWVHQIFGASTVARLLEEVPPHRRAEAAEFIVLEAYFRLRDPVYGSAGVVTGLLQQMEEMKCELVKTLAQIAICRAQQAEQQLIEDNFVDCYNLSDL